MPGTEPGAWEDSMTHPLKAPALGAALAILAAPALAAECIAPANPGGG